MSKTIKGVNNCSARKYTNGRNTIEETIQELINWSSKYPRARFDYSESIDKVLMEYARGNEQEFQRLRNKYRGLQNRYRYLCVRNNDGKLTADQKEQCQEGNIRGNFGYPSTTQQLARKYRISCKKVDYIISKYGSMENYIELYVNGNIDVKSDVILKDNVRPNILIDWNPKTRNDVRYLNLYQATLEQGSDENQLPIRGKIVIFDSQDLVDAIEQLDFLLHRKTRGESFIQIINLCFGLEDGRTYTLKEISKLLGTTRHQEIQHAKKRALQKLRTILQVKEIYRTQGNEKYDFSPEEKKRIDELLERIYRSYIFSPDKEYEDEPNQLEFAELEKMVLKLQTIKANYLKRTGKELEDIPIECLEGLADSLCMRLKAFGIPNIQELMIRINANTLDDVKGLGKDKIDLIKQKLEEFNLGRKLAQKDENGVWVKRIADSDVIVDIANYIRFNNAGIKTAEKVRALRFVGLTSDMIRIISSMDKIQFDEFVNAIQDVEGETIKRVSILRSAGITYEIQLNAIMDLGVEGLVNIRKCHFSDKEIEGMMQAHYEGAIESPLMLAKYYRQSGYDGDMEQRKIDILNLSESASNGLKKAGIFFIKDLISKTSEDLKLRKKQRDEISDKVRAYIMGNELTELSLKRADRLRLEREEQETREKTDGAKVMCTEFENLVNGPADLVQ